MTKEELIKDLELLTDSCMSNYALESNGYNRGVLDAMDLVNKYFALAPVINQVCSCKKVKHCDYEIESNKCFSCGKPVKQTCL